MTDDVDDFLAHFGVKGMKWGVRKDRDKTPLTKNQKIAIAAGSAAVLAGGIAAGIILKNRVNVRMADIAAKTAEAAKAKKAADLAIKRSEALKTQTDIIFSSRAKNIGFTILKDGNSNSPLDAMDAFHPNDQGRADGLVRKIGDKAHVKFIDFEGRTDFAGRPIPHEVVVPFPLSAEINDLADVKEKVWPLLKETYENFYEAGKEKKL